MLSTAAAGSGGLQRLFMHDQVARTPSSIDNDTTLIQQKAVRAGLSLLQQVDCFLDASSLRPTLAQARP